MGKSLVLLPYLVVRYWLHAAITPAIAALVVDLPPSFHRDPGDRLIVATSVVKGATLLTSDRRIIDAELVPTLPARA